VSNSLFNIARYKFATGTLNWSPALNLVLIAWGGDPVFYETDTSVAAIIARAETTVIAHSQDMAGIAVTSSGWLQSGPALLPTVPIGPPVTHLIIATKALSWNDGTPLIYIDTGIDLPFTPDGLDVLIQPDWTEERGWCRL
jgi:hypothetical protein